MRVDEVMQTRVRPFHDRDMIDLQADQPRFRSMPVVPVIDAGGRAVGTVSRTDLLAVAAECRRRVAVRDVMRQPPTMAQEEMELTSAVELMRRHQLSALMVVNDGGRYRGLLCDRDALEALAGRAPPREMLELEVERVMSPDPAVIGEEATVLDAARILIEGGFRHLPVVDTDRRLVGIISERDIRSVAGDLFALGRLNEDELGDSITSLMASSPIAVRTGTALVDVIDVFTREKVGALPVIDDDERVVGIVSYIDVLRLFREPAVVAAEHETAGL